MFSLFGYRQMAADRVRMAAYAAALARAVRPGCTVLDIGAGTGVMSILAAQLGAGRVFAVEPDRAIRVAMQNAEANGCADRIEFFAARSVDVELPAPADVVVSDLRGVLPLHQEHVAAIADARARLLAPGGVMIPLRDTLWGAVAEAPGLYERYAPLEVEGVSLDAGRRVTSHLWTRAHLPAGALLTGAARWAEIDYRTVVDANVRGTLRWTAARNGVAHGLCLWFDAELVEGIGYSGAPGGPELVYGHGFFPFPDPVPLQAGDALEARLRADLAHGEYVWSWNTDIRPRRGDPIAFRQSTLRGSLVSLDELPGR
jgi:type I protein arginine methyltransferase